MPVKAPQYSYAVPGDWNVRPDRGPQSKAKASELIYDEYYGLWVRPKDYDGMHPLDRIEAKDDDQPAPFTNTEPADRFDDTAVLAEGDSKTTSPKYDVGIPAATYNVPVVAVETGNFDDQDDSYELHPDATEGSGVVLVKPSST